jgi:colanic acid/amylovoran biosynthesis glycosyltransferase
VRIAYFTNIYPAVSHTFIRREIRALEALGFMVLRYAVKPDENIVDPKDMREREQTRYITSTRVDEWVRCCVFMLLTRPLGVGGAIVQAIKIGWRSDRGLGRHLVYAAEATMLAYWCCHNAVQHIHAHFGTNPAAIAMLASQISGIPYTFTVHGPEEFDKWAFIALAEKIRRCKFVVAVSSFGRSQLYRCVEPEYWHKVQVIHCGLAPGFFAAVNSPESTARRLVCVGRLSAQKGQLVLIEAARRLASEGEDFELVIAGGGEMQAEIETLIVHYGLQAKVRITGWINGQEVRNEILAARALVVPSFAEGLPVVIMEAMALRRPIIGTFVAGIPELVHSGEHGWLVPASDLDALVDAMRACLNAPVETLKRMGEAAWERVRLRHNIGTEAEKLANSFKGQIGVDPI